MPVPAVTVVVPVRDAAQDLAELLVALAGQRDAPPFEVVVADDGSRDDVDGVVSAACTGAGALAVRRMAVALPGAAAMGPGAARDAALRVARGAIVAFTDADCRPAPGWLRALHGALGDGGAVVQGPVRVPAGATVGPFDRTVQRPRPSPLFETANLAARREDVLAAGGFAHGLRPARGKELGEDVALGWSLVRAGVAVVWCPDAVVVHPVEPRGWRDAANERRRSDAFCALVADWPELRGALLHRRWFFGDDRPRLYLAAAGLLAAAAGSSRAGRIRAAAPGRSRAAVLPTGGPRPSSGQRGPRVLRAGALVAALPELRLLEQRSRRWGRRRQPAVAAGLLAGDLAATAGLLAGSVRTGTLVL